MTLRSSRQSSRGILLGLTLLLLRTLPAHGIIYRSGVQGTIPDARAEAMGGAFTATAEGASGVWWNPGGLGLTRGWWISPYSPLELPSQDERSSEFHSYGISGRVPIGGIGLHLSRTTFDYLGDDGSESSLILGYGRDLVEAIARKPNPRFALGVGASFKRNAMRIPGTTDRTWVHSHGWDIDLGALGRVKKLMPGLPVFKMAPGRNVAPEPSYVAGRVGFTIQNALDRRIDPDRERMGQAVHAGLAIEAAQIPAPPLGHVLTVVAALEKEKNLSGNDLEPEYCYGLEATLFGLVSWRYGETRVNSRYTDSGGGNPRTTKRTIRVPARGLGFRLGNEAASFRLDYSEVRLKRYSLSLHWVP